MVGVVGLLPLLDAAPALAFSATGMPWDGPFQNLLNGLQGGLAHALVAIGIIVAGGRCGYFRDPADDGSRAGRLHALRCSPFAYISRS